MINAKQEMLLSFIRAEGFIERAKIAEGPLQLYNCLIYAGEQLGIALGFVTFDASLKAMYEEFKDQLINDFNAECGLSISPSSDPMSPKRILARTSTQ